MPFFLDIRETSQRFGSDIAKFCYLFDANYIRHGSPDDLFEFAKILESNNSFRLDLSALVKSIVRSEGDELLLTDMVSIIVASVGGPSFADTSADLTKPTNTLMEFLLGTGCWRQFGSPSPPPPQRSVPPLKPPVRAEEPRPIQIPPPVSPVPISGGNTEDQTTLLDASSELRQTLTRLEINTLQVKLHLESIEQRINKIGPASDVVPTETPSSPEPLLQPPGTVDVVAGKDTLSPVPVKDTQSPVEDSPAVEPELPTRGRTVFSHQPQSYQSETDDFSSPTFAFANEKGRNIVSLRFFLVLLAILAAFLFFALFRPGQSSLKGDTSHPNTDGAPAASTPGGPAPASASGAAATVPPVTKTAHAQNTTGTSHPDSAISEEVSSGTSPDAQSSSDGPKLRYIQSNVMEGNLLSAPRPIYPNFARISHIEGKVSMRATISKAGSVKTLHVIKGPQALRSAAIDAVRNWRYKPYLVDGRPVEVATTVYVDFSLKSPPATAY